MCERQACQEKDGARLLLDQITIHKAPKLQIAQKSMLLMYSCCYHNSDLEERCLV